MAKNRILKRNHGLLKRKPEELSHKVDTLIKDTIIEYCGNARYCGDRTPEALQDTLIPGCKYILVHRDPRDVLVSWIYHLFRYDFKFGAEMRKRKEKFQEDSNYYEEHKQELFNANWARKIARDWNRRVNEDLDVLEKSESLGIECLFIQYEELLQHTEEYRNKMFELLNCDPKIAANLSDQTKPGFENHNPNSHYRIGAAGRWTDYFTEKNLAIFERVAQKGMKRLQYKTRTI